MSKKTHDVQEPQPSFPFGPTSDEAQVHAQIARSPLEGPGGIVNTLGLQYQIPRASVDSEINRDGHGVASG